MRTAGLRQGQAIVDVARVSAWCRVRFVLSRGARRSAQGSHVATQSGAGFEQMAAAKERRYYLVRSQPISPSLLLVTLLQRAKAARC